MGRQSLQRNEKTIYWLIENKILLFVLINILFAEYKRLGGDASLKKYVRPGGKKAKNAAEEDTRRVAGWIF